MRCINETNIEMSKIYAVKKGRETGIFTLPWKDVKVHIDGYHGAVYKGFKSIEDATLWMNEPHRSYIPPDTSSSSSDKSGDGNTVVSSSESSFSVIDEGRLVFYTDGSCYNGMGGWAFIQVDMGKNEVVGEAYGHLPSPSTNNQAELTAIMEVMMRFRNERLFIYSDSMYSINSLSKWLLGWKERGWKKKDGKTPENLFLLQMIDELDLSRVKFQHVYGHKGNVFNELVDQLANQGRLMKGVIISHS